jgi:hypoxia up-regulated 1
VTKPKKGASNASNDSGESNETEIQENALEEGNDTSNATQEPEFELKQKKKKHQKDLNVTRVDYRPKPLGEEQIKKLQTRLNDMAAKEEEVAALAGLKNELEAYIYGSRDKLEREDIVKVSTDAQREELTKLCTELEDFMYETGTSKSDYETRLKKLQDLMQPMEERALEFEARADLPDSVKEALSSIKDIQAHITKNMTWVSKNKTEAAEEKLSDFKAWWAKKQESQKSLPLSEAPAYTKQEVMDQLSKVRKEWDKLKKIKKPKETKPKSDKNATNSTSKDKKDKKTEMPMPTDVEGIEKELSALKEKKMDAVEKEDFDAAHVLKQREQALMKQLEKVKAEKSEL